MTTMTFNFAPASRETAKARIGLQGPGGSGKTKTALRMAAAFAAGGEIGLIDTERESALKYAVVPGKPELGGHEFRHLPMRECTPENFIGAVHAAEASGIAVLIIDSWSHFWAGKGGLLARVDQESKKPGHFGGSYTAWAPVNDLEQDMLDALLGFRGHVIVTMRTKNDYEMTGKTVTKVGVKTIQREGAEYEFDVIIDMVKGTGTVTKTRYEPLDDLSVHHPGEELAEQVMVQLGQGVDPLVVITDALAVEGLTLDDVLRIQGDAARRRLTQTGLLHPKRGEPTTLATLMQERLGETIVSALADDFLTYQGALDLYGRGDRGGWLKVPYTDQETGEITTLGDLIRARGTELKPTGESTGDAGTGGDQQPTPSESVPGPGEGATPPQTRKIFASMKELGMDPEDRDKRLRAVGLIIGRRIETMTTLTFGEASEVIETFADFTGDDAPDRFKAHLNNLLAKASQANAA